MRTLVPVYLGSSGTNHAVIALDHTTSKIWTRDYDSFLGGTGNLAGTSVVATVSGHTMLSDTLTCLSSGAGSSWKQTSSTSQNQTATLADFTSVCLTKGFPAATAGYNMYGNNTCGGAPTASAFLWEVRLSKDSPRVVFLLYGGGQPNTMFAFVGNSDSICFPVTMSNLIPVGGVGADFTAGGFTGKRYGHSGSVTLSLSDYVCE